MKKQFRQLRLKNPKQQKLVRQLLGCVHEKFDGFNIICVEYSKKLRKKFKPIDITYKPVRKPERNILCYSSEDMSKAYRSSCSQGEKISHGFAFECYYCGKFFTRADKHNNQNLITFEDNLKFKGDLPMAIYYDFETTAPTDNCFEPEQKEVFVVSYVMTVAFHPDFKLNRIIVQRSFVHSI